MPHSLEVSGIQMEAGFHRASAWAQNSEFDFVFWLGWGVGGFCSARFGGSAEDFFCATFRSASSDLTWSGCAS